MLDTIRLHLPRKEAQGLATRLQDYRRRDVNTGSGHIGSMQVYHNLDEVTIHGSIAKYLQGKNITPLSRAGVRAAVEKLEAETSLRAYP